MAYYTDLERISLDAFKQILAESILVPSRMILQEHADVNFDLLVEHNVSTVHDVLQFLKNKKGITDLSSRTGIDEEYLTILAREIKGYKRKPIRIKEFLGLKENVAGQLSKAGIENGLQLYDQVLTFDKRQLLCRKTGIDENDLLMIIKMVDLSRVRWVNHTFAYVLYEAGYDTAEKIATTDAQELYISVKQLNEERKFFPAHIGLNDIKRCIEAAKLLSFDIEY